MSADRSRSWSRVRFALSWVIALVLVVVAVPKALAVSWHGLIPVLGAVPWTALLGLVVLWVLGLIVHSFVLTAAAPELTHRRALTLNVTGSAVANVVPLGGAAGVELNRRMMRAWGIEGRGFTGFTFLTNLWDVASKLLLPVVAVLALAHAGEAVIAPLRLAAIIALIGFTGLVGFAAMLMLSPRSTTVLGRIIERVLRLGLRLVGRTSDVDMVRTLLDVRSDCVGLVAKGWLRMSLGIMGYVALQGLLLALCLNLTGSGNTWAEVLAGFALERLLTILPITPGGVGVADLGLVGVLVAFGGDPTGAAAGALLYRLFVFAVEIPVGGGALGLWLLGRRRLTRLQAFAPQRTVGVPQRIAHVTDVFLPRLGGIETHVDDLVRHQQAAGLDAVVLTPTEGEGQDPEWVRRMPLGQARREIGEYDVVHVHLSMLSPFGLGVARAAATAGVPTLITIHSMWAGAGGVVRLAALAGLRRWPVAWSAVSGAAAEIFGRSFAGADVAVLPNAIDVASWRPGRRPDLSSAPATPRRLADGDPVTLVSVMRLMPRKRPVQLLRMFQQVRALTPGRDVRLVIVGDGPMRGRMQRYISRHRLQDSVRLTGRLPRDEVLDELLASSVYVAPAPKESFGLAALEARAAGLPVVAHRRSGVGEFVRDRVDGLLVADDVEMTVALAELVTDAELHERIAGHNRRVAPPFDWATVQDRTMDLYLEAVRVSARERATAGDARPTVSLAAEG